jgi:hypothetical protein
MPSLAGRRKRAPSSPSCASNLSGASMSRRPSSPASTSGRASGMRRSTSSNATRRTAAPASSPRSARSTLPCDGTPLPAPAAESGAGVSRQIWSQGAHHRLVAAVTAVGTCVALRATAPPQDHRLANCSSVWSWYWISRSSCSAGSPLSRLTIALTRWGRAMAKVAHLHDRRHRVLLPRPEIVLRCGVGHMPLK